MSEKPVVIVGGGWAGLSTAVELCNRKVPVILLESARQLGGRARSVRINGTIVDNGQHLVTGAYQSLLTLMQKVNVDPDRAFLRQPLTLNILKGETSSLRLKAPPLPAPFHLLAAIITAHGLSITDRLHTLQFGRRLARLDISADEDISVQTLLHSEAQTPTATRKLWEPLCIATLNTPIREASARVFTRVLQESFLHLARHSDLLIPRMELSDILPRPCATYLEQRGACVELGQRVTGLDIPDGSIHAVRIGERRVEASHVVLATQHVISRRLMSPHALLKPLCSQLARLGNEPVATLYFKYPSDVRLPQTLIGLEDRLGQWVFDRSICGQPGMIAVVISARGAHTDMTAEELIDKAGSELAASFPGWPAPIEARLIREKRATFSSRVGIDRDRPANGTAVPNLWLAGDYTINGLPATLECAVQSGINCAKAILNRRSL